MTRVAGGGSERWWLAFGSMAGLGLENKHSMLFLGFGVTAGLLFTAERRQFAGRWLWLGAVLAFALFAPNLLWEVRHGWPTLEFLRNAQLHKDYHASLPEFLLGQLQLIHPVASAVSVAGLWYLFSPKGRRYRVLGFAYLAVLALFVVEGAKVYYLAPVYPMLIAPGGAKLEELTAGRTWYERVTLCS